MTNPEVYPITAKFEQQVNEQLQKNAVDPIKMDMNGYARWTFAKSLGEKMAEILGEYEHGTADVEDLISSELLDKYMNARRDWEEVLEGSDEEDVLKQDLRKECLETASTIYFDLFLSLFAMAENAG